MSPQPTPFITPEALLVHWQGHRRLTRRIIEAFPDDRLFAYTLGSMRPFGEMVTELLSMAVPMVRGLVTGEWEAPGPEAHRSKADLLARWDQQTEELTRWWRQIPPVRFRETVTAFGVYTGPAHDLILLVIDNEVHHRGQAYVYLRTLGIEPPPFQLRG